jgi:hypothetical protein
VNVIGIETSATERIALARELAAVRRDQYRRSRAEARLAAAGRPAPAPRPARLRARSAGRA